MEKIVRQEFQNQDSLHKENKSLVEDQNKPDKRREDRNVEIEFQEQLLSEA